MTSRCSLLLDICQNFLAGRRSVSEYLLAFDDSYYFYRDKLTPREEAIFEAVFLTNEIFEPNEAIRMDDVTLIDEAELRRRVQAYVNKLTA